MICQQCGATELTKNYCPHCGGKTIPNPVIEEEVEEVEKIPEKPEKVNFWCIGFFYLFIFVASGFNIEILPCILFYGVLGTIAIHFVLKMDGGDIPYH